MGETAVGSFKNPWWVVVGAVTGLFVCNGPVLSFTFGVFLKPIMADMGAQRGTVSLAFGIGGICSALMVPVLSWMMDRWSIRRVALPGIILYAVAKSDVPGLTVREAAGTGRFWILLAIFFLVAIALNGTVAHVVPLLTDAGLSPAKAAATMGVFGLATMTGRLLAGYLVDRFFAAHVAAVLFLAPIAGFALLASAAGSLPAVGVTLV